MAGNAPANRPRSFVEATTGIEPVYAVLPDPAVASWASVGVYEWVREGARQGSIGLVADMIAKYEPWRFSPADVTQDAGVWAGEADGPSIHTAVAYFVATIPRASAVTYPDAGHLLTIPHWAEMLALLH